jgi:predicted CoA-binding protein
LTHQSVIVLGASPQRWRFSNKAVRCYREEGYRVFPVHPTAPEVEGIPAVASLDRVPEPAELLLVYVRPEIGLRCVENGVPSGIRSVTLNPGTSRADLVRRLAELGLEVREECAIVALGRSPSEFPG